MGRFIAIATGLYVSTLLMFLLAYGGNAPFFLALDDALGLGSPEWTIALCTAFAAGGLFALGYGVAISFGMGLDGMLKSVSAVFIAGLALFFWIAGMPPGDQQYPLIAIQMVLAVLTVILMSCILTASVIGLGRTILLPLLRGFLSLPGVGTAIRSPLKAIGLDPLQRRFPLFVGWTLLRSHRRTPTLKSRYIRGLHDWLQAKRLARWRWLLSAAVLTGAALLLGTYKLQNALAVGVSPLFATTVQAALLFMAAGAFLYGFPSLIPRTPKPTPSPVMKVANWVTLPSFMSIVGVSVGVWALIVVLSVMDGFASDLRAKILETNAHVVVEAQDVNGTLEKPYQLQDALRANDKGAQSTTSATGEVMISSPTNVVVNVVLKGLNEADMAQAKAIQGKVKTGAIKWLFQPEALLTDRFRYPVEWDMGGDPGGWPPTPKKAEDTKPNPDASAPPPTADTAQAPTEKTAPSRLSPTWEPQVKPGILLGSELANNLRVDVGGEVKVISPDGEVGPTGLRPKLKSFRVAGVFKTGMYEYDQKLAYTSLAAAQRFLNLDDQVNRLEVRFESSDNVDDRVAAIRTLLTSKFPKLKASDWRERNKSLFSALELERIAMFTVLAFIILVASMLILSSLVMIIVERVRDIAVFKALGASNGAIVKSFLVIGTFIGGIGVASGSVLGWVTAWCIREYGPSPGPEYYIDQIPVKIDPSEIGLVAIAALGLCLIATLYPSYIATRLKPVEGFRHG